MALTFAEALVVYPPSVPSRCIEKRPFDDPACPPCPPCLPRSPCTPTCGQSSVQFQLTYTCDRSTYAPCYRPTKPTCYLRPKPIRKTCCCLKWYDCCGNPVFKSCS